MAELLGVVASLVGIAGVGIKLSKTLYVAAEKHVNAGHNINRVATNVTLFSSMLKHFASVLQDAGSLHSPEALATAKQIVDECHSVFSEIGNIVLASSEKPEGRTNGPVGANDRKRRLSMIQKVKWHFEQPKVEWLTAQLEYLKTTLSVLIQTLHLAAFLAKTKQAEQVTEPERQRINEERIHVETLIVARQLSVVILQQFEKAQEQRNQQSGRVSPTDSEVTLDARQPTLESRQPKLLTQYPAEDMSLVKLGGGNLAFLDRTGSQPIDAAFPAMLPSPVTSPIIDQLLGRMTRLDEVEVNVNEKKSKSVDLEDQALQDHVEAINSIQKDIEQSPEAIEKRDGPPPDLKLQLVDSNSESQITNTQSLSAPPRGPPPRAGSNAARTPPPPPPSNRGPLLPPPNGGGPSMPGGQFISDGPPPRDNKLGLARSTTSPEPEMHPYAPLDRSVSPLSNSQSNPPAYSPTASRPVPQSSYIPTPTSPTRSANSPSTSPRSSVTADWYTNPRGIAAPVQGPPLANARSERIPFGSRNSSPGPATPTSEDDEDPERGQRLGLGIPWRIRIGPNKYFDFLDDRLVGPRTPYLPSEPLSWVYSHDNACTEISASWVAEEAIAEAKYSYTEAHAGEEAGGDFMWSSDPTSRVGENKIKWKLFSALKFKEVEDLVERTIDLYRQRQNNPPKADSDVRGGVPQQYPPPQQYSTPQQPILPQQAPPPQQQRGPNLAPPPMHTGATPLQQQPFGMQPQANRSASFSTFPSRNIRADWDRPLNTQEPFSPVARGPPWVGSPSVSSSTGSGMNVPNYPYYAGNPQPGPTPYATSAPKTHRDTDWNDWGQNPRYDINTGPMDSYRSERSADFRDSMAREMRPTSRGKDRARDTGKRSMTDPKKKKDKTSSVTSTMAKIAGLAALLEGLDTM